MTKNHQLGFFLILKQCFFLMLILTPWTKLSAGLIIDIDKNIDVSKISNIITRGDELIIEYPGGTRVLKLPNNALDPVILWAKKACVGPFVFSVDGALVPGAPDYMAPCLPPNLGEAMLHYDVYAHSLAQGQMPDDTLLHPLVKLHKNTLLMPYQQYKLLMNINNNSPEALWFRRLASRYPSYPGCIGEFTIHATASKKGFPVGIKARSYRWIRPHLWYRASGVSVPNEQDHLALSLPYNGLDQHIESNFDDYRRAFQPLDELASIVEAYAVLGKVATTNPQLWNKLILARYKSIDLNENSEPIAASSYPDLGSMRFYSKPTWVNLSTQWIGDRIETSAEADLALSLLWNESAYSWSDPNPLWLAGIRQIANNDTDIRCKLILFNAKTNKEDLGKNIATFFNYASRGMKNFRLRVMGYKLFLKQIDRLNYDDEEKKEENGTTGVAGQKTETNYKKILAIEKQNILNDFIAEVDKLKKASKDNTNLIVWEDLSQSVYSVGLLDLLNSEYDAIDAEFSKRLAYVHYRRGIIDQKGLTLAYRHAHFRFLKYLYDLSEYDEELENDISKYRTELAQKMGLKGWDEHDFDYESYDLDSEEEEDLPEGQELHLSYPLLEGKIIPAQMLFNSALTIKEGSPLCLQTPEGKNILLLMDSRIINNAFGKTASKWPKNFKVYGIFQNNKNAITPQRIEYYLDNKWQVLNLPHSGISESGVLSGN